MLDFYLIKDQQSKPEYPEQADLKYIAGLDHATFHSLVKKDISIVVLTSIRISGGILD